MSKRNLVINAGPESKALKLLRKQAGVSIRKLADLMEISHTRVHQMESGRENIADTYVKKFLSTLELTTSEWTKLTKSKKKKIDMKEECIELVQAANRVQMEEIYLFLKNI